MRKSYTSFVVIILLVVIIGCNQNDKKKVQPNYLFTHHFISNNLPTQMIDAAKNRYQSCGVQSLADYDNDGDLDMTIGLAPLSNPFPGLFLFENRDSVWVTREIGSVPFVSLGAASLDVDGDGWVDLVSGAVWYKNNKDYTFSMHTYDDTFLSEEVPAYYHTHDIALADINGDGKMDVLAAGEKVGIFWYDTDTVPGKNWKRTTIDPNFLDYKPQIHGGFSPEGIGDLDGDGDLDVFHAMYWYENQDQGKSWMKHSLENDLLFRGKLPYGKSTRSVIVDIDYDGDNDIVFSTCDDIDGKIGIIENINGDGSEWKFNFLPQTAEGRRCSLHGLRVADFDMDGFLDIITVDQEDMMEEGVHSPRWYMYTNTGGGWKEQVLFDMGLGGHDILIGDVDNDGDIDIVSKVWSPWKDNAIGGKPHADFFENLTIDN